VSEGVEHHVKNEDEIDEYHKFIYKVYLLNYTKLKKTLKN